MPKILNQELLDKIRELKTRVIHSFELIEGEEWRLESEQDIIRVEISDNVLYIGAGKCEYESEQMIEVAEVIKMSFEEICAFFNFEYVKAV